MKNTNKLPLRLLILANHDNGYNIVNYLCGKKNANIIKLVVYEDSKKQWWKSVLKLAKQKNIDYIIFKDNKTLLSQIQKLDIDLILSVSWRHIIPASILHIPKKGAVNFHNSMLPKYRGAYANAWPLIFGETNTAVTLHYMTERFDDGKILWQEQLPIYLTDTAKETWQRININYLSMFKKAWKLVYEWERLARPQIGKPSYFSIADFEKTNEIDLDKKMTARDFINFLRAKTFEPFYRNAYFIDPKTQKKISLSISLHEEKK